jgi:hypothetical protein
MITTRLIAAAACATVTTMPTESDGWNDDIETELQLEREGTVIERTHERWVTVLTARIAYLEAKLKRLHPNAGEEIEIECLQHIADARQRLDEYQTLLNARN